MHSTTFNDKILRCVNNSEDLSTISYSTCSYPSSLVMISSSYLRQFSRAKTALIEFYFH